MFKTLVIAGMSCLPLYSGIVLSDCEPDFYVGVDVKANRPHHSGEYEIPRSLKKAKASVGAFFGSRFTKHIGMEAGYGVLGKWKHSFDPSLEKTKIGKYHGYLDICLYAPMSSFELVGSAGIGYIDAHIRHSEIDSAGVYEVSKVKLHTVGPHLGLGVQYKFTDQIGMKVMTHYQHAYKHTVKYVTTAKVGVFYQF